MYTVITPLIYYCEYPDSCNLISTCTVFYNLHKDTVKKQKQKIISNIWNMSNPHMKFVKEPKYDDSPCYYSIDLIKNIFKISDDILPKTTNPINTISSDQVAKLPKWGQNLVYSGQKKINLPVKYQNFIYDKLNTLLDNFLNDNSYIISIPIHRLILEDAFKHNPDIDVKSIFKFFKNEIIIPLNKGLNLLNVLFKNIMPYQK